MDLDLTGKVALVSGSTRGIGLATAMGLAQMGASVIINGRQQDAVEEARAKVLDQVKGATVHAAAYDLGTAEGCARIIEAHPHADILVNNLGIYEPKPYFDIEDQDWAKMFEVNVMSGVRLSRGYFPGMLERNWGRVIFISSESGLAIPGEMVHYGMTKSAQLAVARGMAQQTKGTGVTVNSVLP
eukprot:gene11920-15163_t